MRRSPHERESGMTLIELLAALLISGFVVAMASRIFLSGHLQFLRRSADSERMNLFYRLKAETQGALAKEIVSCESGRLAFLSDSGKTDAAEWLKRRIPALSEARFACLEPASDGATLQDWKDASQPPLVEYILRVRLRGEPDSMTGSWLR
jgi:prepilin-type N-terminal cleavage/methylation domain-containing protein